MKRCELPVERRLEGDPKVLLKLEVPCLEPIFACGRGQTLVALESLQKDSRVKEGRPHNIADRLVTNLEKGEKFNKDVCQVFLDDSEAVLRDGVDYEVRHSFDGPDHWHGSSVHCPESQPGLVTN